MLKHNPYTTSILFIFFFFVYNIIREYSLELNKFISIKAGDIVKDVIYHIYEKDTFCIINHDMQADTKANLEVACKSA